MEPNELGSLSKASRIKSFTPGEKWRVTLPKAWIDDLDLVNGTKIGAWETADGWLVIDIDDGQRKPFGVKVWDWRLSKKDKSVTVSLPTSWLENLKAESDDRFDIYRDQWDRLVIVKGGNA